MVAWAGADAGTAPSHAARQAIADDGLWARGRDGYAWSIGFVAFGRGDLAWAERELS